MTVFVEVAVADVVAGGEDNRSGLPQLGGQLPLIRARRSMPHCETPQAEVASELVGGAHGQH